MTTYENGRIPASELTQTYLYYPGTANGRYLLDEVAPYAEALGTAFYLEFSKPLFATDGYRDIDTQWVVWRKYLAGTGAPAATPGTSNHGWAKALDLASNVNSFGTPEHEWMRANAARFGWKHPDWARQGGGREEAWHWEFVGGGTAYPRVLRPGASETGLGDQGSRVTEIQNLLRKRGYEVTADGDYGLGTATAVLRFQKRRGLKMDGVVGDATLKALRPRPFHNRVTTAPTHVYRSPGRGAIRLLPEGQNFTVWDGAAQKRFLTWYVQTTSGNWVRSTKTKKV